MSNDRPSHSSTGDRETISELTTGRLSVYLRCLTFLESVGQSTVSSSELADRFHLNSAQIRKDLACLGEVVGIRGVGYDVSVLREYLIRELGLDRTRRVLIAGAGNLGMALADYAGFNDNGFQIAALVDNDPAKIGRRSRSGIEVLPWDELAPIIREHHVDIGIVAVNAEAAQTVYDAFADAGLNAVLNFAPTQLRSRPGVKVKSVDLRINLESLSFYLKNVEDGGT
jgi:redox-sensing transcriptional repressor